MYSSNRQYVGIDLHSDRFTCHFLSEQKHPTTATYLLSNFEMEKFVSKLSKESYVAFEASTNSFSFADELEKKGFHHVYVLDPLKLSIIYNSGKKTDKVDASKISQILQYHIKTDKNFLPTIYKPEKSIRELRSLFTTYYLYKKEITQLKNRIHSLLKQNLFDYSKVNIFTSKGKKVLETASIDFISKLQIEILYSTVQVLEEKALKLRKIILLKGSEHRKTVDKLLQIGGIGVFTAIGVISDMGSIERFKKSKSFSSYLRAAPKVDSSNKTTYIKGINKRSRKVAMHLLNQSLGHLKRTNTQLSSFYTRLRKGKSAGKARVAAIRKIIVAIFYMLKNDEDYKYLDTELWNRKKAEYDNFLKKNTLENEKK